MSTTMFLAAFAALVVAMPGDVEIADEIAAFLNGTAKVRRQVMHAPVLS